MSAGIIVALREGIAVHHVSLKGDPSRPDGDLVAVDRWVGWDNCPTQSCIGGITLEEIGRLLSAHPHIVKTKKVFPGRQ